MATLFLVTTPIGNLEDLSYRAVRVLGEVGALACEDTRVTRVIFEKLELHRPQTIFAYHEHNEAVAGRRILGFLNDGVDVALCTDGGCPGISDPGYRITGEAIEQGHRIDVIPGPSAVTTALMVSGLSTATFTFKGFPPRKTGARKRFLEQDANLPHTLVVFESPHRLGAFLIDALEVLGDRKAAICIELTKKFEEVKRGHLSELAPQFEGKKIKGEVSVVIAGNNPKFLREADDTDEDE